MIMSTDHWADLELRHLQSFAAVAETGSFHEAAERLEYTQSAVSQHVAALESIVGVRLLERSRGRRTVEVTEAGRLLLRHADAVLARLSAARADLRAYAAGEAGVLRVGTYQSVGTHILPAVVGRFSAAWPGVDVQLTEGSSDSGMQSGVESGALDLTFGVLPLPEGPFEGVELLRDPYMLVVPAASPLAGLPAMPSADAIAGESLIAFRSCRSLDAVEAQLRHEGCEPRFVFRSDDNGTLQAMVAAGIGSALVPLLAIDTGSPAVRVIRTDLPPRRIALMWHRDRYRSPAMRAFVEMALDVGARVQRALAPELEPDRGTVRGRAGDEVATPGGAATEARRSAGSGRSARVRAAGPAGRSGASGATL